jgi:hypothetical protein
MENSISAIREQMDKFVPYEMPEWLKEFYRDDGIFPMIYHRYYVGVVTPLIPTNCPTPEEVIEQKMEQVRVAVDKGYWDQYIWLHERPYRASALRDLWTSPYLQADIDDAMFGKLCRMVWVDSENINQNIDFWLAVFREIDGKHWMEEKEKNALDKFHWPITIYRGECEDGGVSWSLCKKVAQFFANRGIHNSTGVVTTSTAKRDDVYAYLTSRNEDEIIIKRSALADMALL